MFIVNNFGTGFLNMETKICSTCKIEKSIAGFSKDKKTKDGLQYQCKKCNREWYKNNKEKSKETHRKWVIKNRRKVNLIAKRSYDRNIELRRLNAVEYGRTHKEEKNKYIRNKRKININFRINGRMSSNIRRSLKGNKNGRQWETLVGYTQKDLMEHLKLTMPKGYDWDDFLNNILHIDHKIPLSLFNIKGIKSKGFKKAWSLENLRLLPAGENLRKGNKLFYYEA